VKALETNFLLAETLKLKLGQGHLQISTSLLLLLTCYASQVRTTGILTYNNSRQFN